jgi:hypothetical protein
LGAPFFKRDREREKRERRERGEKREIELFYLKAPLYVVNM